MLKNVLFVLFLCSNASLIHASAAAGKEKDVDYFFNVFKDKIRLNNGSVDAGDSFDKSRNLLKDGGLVKAVYYAHSLAYKDKELRLRQEANEIAKQQLLATQQLCAATVKQLAALSEIAATKSFPPCITVNAHTTTETSSTQLSKTTAPDAKSNK